MSLNLVRSEGSLPMVSELGDQTDAEAGGSPRLGLGSRSSEALPISAPISESPSASPMRRRGLTTTEKFCMMRMPGRHRLYESPNYSSLKADFENSRTNSQIIGGRS